MIGRRTMLPTEFEFSTLWRNMLFLIDRFLRSLLAYRKFVRTSVRKTRRATLVYTRRQYFIPAVIRDVKQAAGQNEDILIASVVMFLLVSYGVAVLTAQFLVSVFSITYDFAEALKVEAALFIFVMAGLLTMTSLLLAAFSKNFIACALMDGINRKQKRSIRSTAKKSLRLAGRTVLAWLFYGLMLVSRLVVLAFAALLYVKWIMTWYAAPLPVLIMCGAAGAIWVLSGMLRYSLVPTVALFEPGLLIIETFERSRRLTARGSKPFLLVGGTLLAMYGAALYGGLQYLKPWAGALANLLLVLGLLTGVMVANAALAMLYRKRKLART